MNKKFILSVVVLFVLWMGLGFLVHGTILQPDYTALGDQYRPVAEQQQYMPYMLFAHLLMAIGFTWIYQRGREQKPFLGQGLRFGFAVAVLAAIPLYLIYYAVQPLPLELVMKQIVYETIGLLFLGVVVAWLNR